MKWEPSDSFWKYCGCFTLLFVFLLLILFAGLCTDDKQTEGNKVINSSWDASVWQVERYLKKEYLKDPSSYESISWSKVFTEQNNPNFKYYVRHKYRAKNSFGGYAIEEKIFFLDSNGKVVDTQDIY